MASVEVAKNFRFRGKAGLEGQEGRQKIPVVFTPVKKMPSKLGSRSRVARSMILMDGKRFIMAWYTREEEASTDF